MGRLVIPRLLALGWRVTNLDPRAPGDWAAGAAHIPASITDRAAVFAAMAGQDIVLHVAALHGIHEFRGEASAEQFWDVDVGGTFNVRGRGPGRHRQDAVHVIDQIQSWPGLYGASKTLAEELTRTYAARHGMNVLTLRPRAFIPFWNRGVYANYTEWLRWFWRGAVEISDVAEATLAGLAALNDGNLTGHHACHIDCAEDLPPGARDAWQREGAAGFARLYPDYAELALRHDLPTNAPPRRIGHDEATRLFGYAPRIGLAQALDVLARHGENPPAAAFS